MSGIKEAKVSRFAMGMMDAKGGILAGIFYCKLLNYHIINYHI
jgi:hypothetical protein